MGTRLDLQTEFEDLLGSRNVYFQAPPNIKMIYPCVRYNSSGIDSKYADNNIYNYTRRYEGVVIDPNPDSEIPYNIIQHFPMCILGSPYVADNLYHFPFTLYY